MASGRAVALACAALAMLLVASPAGAFYLPGVAPRAYDDGEEVEIKVSMGVTAGVGRRWRHNAASSPSKTVTLTSALPISSSSPSALCRRPGGQADKRAAPAPIPVLPSALLPPAEDAIPQNQPGFEGWGWMTATTDSTASLSLVLTPPPPHC